jgi:exopolyphosphatase / guanosine-5'-triphosphate,3'-diphosphate pyrophosphatase
VKRVAVIDVGSMSTRLLVTDGAGRGDRHQVVTRLNEGLAPGGAFADGALARVGAALGRYRQVLERAGVDDVTVVATAAARRAGDTGPLAALVLDTLGVGLEVLSAAEEASLAFAGATAGLDRAGPVLMLDIGGGSTEFVIGEAAGPVTGWWSAELGAGTLTDTYLGADPPSPWELSAALSVVELHVDDVIREVDGLGEVLRDGTVVGVGGTVTTVAAVELGLRTYDPDRIHHFGLSRDAVEDVFRTLATESAADRAHNPGLPADRVEVIVGGSCVLVEVMRRLGIDEILVSEADLLDGVAARRLAGR